MNLVKIAIFASGSGTNAENIIKYFQKSDLCKVELVLSNKNNAYVLERARQLGVASTVFSVSQLNESTIVDDILEQKRINFIILAGFLLKIPQRIINKYPSKIINIHPALLPSHGGKGMYGINVHRVVIEAGEPESGITIHLVDEHYDKGRILFRTVCDVTPEDTPETLAAKVHLLEYRYYPEVIENFLTESLN